MRHLGHFGFLLCAWAAAATTGCGALLELDSYSTAAGGGSAHGGGAGDGGSAGAGVGGGLANCGVDGQCATQLAGWTGPVALSDGSPTSVCDDPYEQLVEEGTELVAAPDAVCDCTCDAPAAEVCSGPYLARYTEQTCPPQPAAPALLGCSGAISPPPSAVAMRATPVDPQAGICDPTSSETVPPVTSMIRRLCRPNGAEPGCADGQTCMPRPGAGFEPLLCVYTGGDELCPSAFGYADKHILFREGLTDTRSCTTCECGPSDGGECGGTTTLHLNGTCSSPKLDVPHDDSCVTFTAGFSSMFTSVTLTAPGVCPAIGGVPSGEVVGSDPITVCCTPPL